MYFNRYFRDYFSHSDSNSMLLNDITLQFAHGYWDWRKAYWTEEKGAKLRDYNPKRRGSKTRGTANAKAVPALKTLLMEQSALNQIFYDAFEKGRMQQVFKLRVAERGQTPNRRDGFDTGKENLVLVRKASRLSQRQTEQHFHGQTGLDRGIAIGLLTSPMT